MFKALMATGINFVSAAAYNFSPLVGLFYIKLRKV
jgi:hypothetical protein